MGKSKLALVLGLLTQMALAQPVSQPAAPAAAPRGAYQLGPDDVIAIRAMEAEEITDRGIRIGPNGTINLPMVGRVQAGGLTAEELEKELITRLKPFIRNPEVSVNVVELRSQPVSVIGSVTSPGVHQLQGRKTLVEMLSLAGGARVDAGYSVKVTRRKEWGPIPLANAAVDPSGQFSVAEVNLKAISEARNPTENIYIMPNDVISVPRAEMVFVIGDVKRPGGFALGETANMSILQAVALASGLDRTASATKAKILRVSATKDLKRTEIAVNLKRIQEGKDQDVAMEPQDILFVPGSRTRVMTIRALEMMLQVGTGIATYRGY